MPKVTNELLQDIMPFMVQELGEKIFEGITYTLIPSSDKIKIDTYQEIRDKITQAGIDTTTLFRVYQLCNGTIFDLDLVVAKKLAIIMLKENADEKFNNMINTLPAKRKQEDMERLATQCLKEAKNKNKEFYVALFSKNKSPSIRFNAKVEGETTTRTFSYPAYALRHWDLEDINMNYLIPKGLMIDKVQACEILPTRTGVKFKIILNTVEGEAKR